MLIYLFFLFLCSFIFMFIYLSLALTVVILEITTQAAGHNSDKMYVHTRLGGVDVTDLGAAARCCQLCATSVRAAPDDVWFFSG